MELASIKQDEIKKREAKNFGDALKHKYMLPRVGCVPFKHYDADSLRTVDSTTTLRDTRNLIGLHNLI